MCLRVLDVTWLLLYLLSQSRDIYHFKLRVGPLFLLPLVYSILILAVIKKELFHITVAMLLLTYVLN